MKTDYDVVIVGYGPTGAVAANLLGAQGLSVLVIEPETEIYNIPRAVHFDGEVLRIFQHLGLDQQALAVSEPGIELNFVNGRNWHLMYQDMREIPRIHFWENSHFFSQPRLESHLREGVARFDNVIVFLGHEMRSFEQKDSGVTVEVVELGTKRTQLISCRYLLGCDGASSPTRKLAEIDQLDLKCDEPWLVCDWVLEEGTEFHRGAYQVCDPVRPTTMVPCEGTHIRWEFMLNENDDLAAMEDEQNVRTLIAPHVHRLSPGIDSQQGQLVRSKVYQFHALLASSFQKENVFLLGDAAHQMPPFLGQGMCAGMRDAYNLCWKLAGVVHGEYNEKILDTYTSERQPQVKTIVGEAVNMGSVIQSRNPIKSFLRDCYLKIGSVFPVILADLEIGGGWSLGSGIWESGHSVQEKHVVGRPVPQTLLHELPTQEQAQHSGLSDSLLGEGFSALVFNSEHTDDLRKAVQNNVVPITFAQLDRQDPAINRVFSLSQWLDTYDVAALLIRPDRQVFGVCTNEGNAIDQMKSMLASLNRQCLS